jgi:hypothetical protein
MFIPAGRSFFTSVGKAIAVFEHGGILDPITVQFGRIFASIRERRGLRYYSVNEPKISQTRRKNLMQQFFGGSIEYARDEEFVKTLDGRKNTVRIFVVRSARALAALDGHRRNIRSAHGPELDFH